MFKSIKANLGYLLKFLWDPEKTVALPQKGSIPKPLLSPFTLFTLLLVAGVLYQNKIAHLTCWTPAFYSVSKMYLLLGGYFFLVLATSYFKKERVTILLWGSITLSLGAAPAMTLLALAFILLYWLVVRTDLPRFIKHLWVIILHGGAMALYNFKLMPEFVFDPIWSKAGLMFAFFIPLRLFWYHYQLSREHFARLTFREIFTYFFLVPAPIMIPYMFALPRRANLEKIKTPQTRILARGTLYIATGITFYLAFYLLKTAFTSLAALPGLGFVLIPWGYPLEPVFWALGSAYMIAGLYNRLGAEVTLAFRSPLNSPSVLEWWRRWNVHFRDMLVDMFFYPFVMGRRKKHPYLRIWAGVFGVFIVGSTIFHLVVKHYFLKATLIPYWSIMVENSVMFLAVGILLHWEKYTLVKARKKRKEARKKGIKLPRRRRKKPWPLRILSYPLTYSIVFISVVGGYFSTVIIEGTYIDRPTAIWQYSDQLKQNNKQTEGKYYLEQAVSLFETSLEGVKDLDSPFKFKEKHAALKLIIIYYNTRRYDQIPALAAKLGWGKYIKPNNSPRNRYLAIKNRALWEITRLKGLNGLKALLAGKI